jgi:hypothetical protein
VRYPETLRFDENGSWVATERKEEQTEARSTSVGSVDVLEGLQVNDDDENDGMVFFGIGLDESLEFVRVASMSISVK